MFLLGIPGAVGAYVGATLLSSLSIEAARPWVSVILLALGVVIIARFLHGRRTRPPARRRHPQPKRPVWLLVPLA